MEGLHLQVESESPVPSAAPLTREREMAWRSSTLALIAACKRIAPNCDDKLRGTLDGLLVKYDNGELDKRTLSATLQRLVGTETVEACLKDQEVDSEAAWRFSHLKLIAACKRLAVDCSDEELNKLDELLALYDSGELDKRDLRSAIIIVVGKETLRSAVAALVAATAQAGEVRAAKAATAAEERAAKAATAAEEERATASTATAAADSEKEGPKAKAAKPKGVSAKRAWW
jgi:hypothetical protein